MEANEFVTGVVMGKATGVFLILAGVGTAALVLPTVDKDAERQLGEIVRIATGAASQSDAKGPAARAVDDPTVLATGTPVPLRQLKAEANSADKSNATRRLASSARSPDVAKQADAPMAAATVTSSKFPVASDAATTAAPVLIAPPQPSRVLHNNSATPARPLDTQSRQTLARDIQKELKRVGCYDGEVSGEWNQNTRRAMKAFIDRVNAALPIEEPDHILRTMVQGHPGHACGKGCPAGQSMANDGRCLPAVVVAQQSAPKLVRPGEASHRDIVVIPKELATRNTPPQAQQQASVTVRPAVPKPAWETTVTTAPVIAAPATPLPTTPLSTESRMAIGGPVPAPSPTVLVAPRTASTTASGSSLPLSTTARMPGAIAAFAAGASTATASPASSPAISDGAQRTGVTVASPLVRDPGQLVPPAVSENQPAKPRDRPRHADAVRRPSPEVFKFPAPSYLGIAASNFVAKFPQPQRSKFTVKIYEKMNRELR